MFPNLPFSIQDIMLLNLINLQQQQQYRQKIQQEQLSLSLQSNSIQKKRKVYSSHTDRRVNTNQPSGCVMNVSTHNTMTTIDTTPLLVSTTPSTVCLPQQTFLPVPTTSMTLSSKDTTGKKRKFDNSVQTSTHENISEEKVKKEIRYEKEKKRRMIIRAKYAKLSDIISTLGISKKPKQKMDRLEILKAIIKLISPSVEEFVKFEKLIAVKPSDTTNPLLPKKKRNSINEKKRRERLRVVLNKAGSLVGLDNYSEQGDILDAILKRLSFVTESIK